MPPKTDAACVSKRPPKGSASCGRAAGAASNRLRRRWQGWVKVNASSLRKHSGCSSKSSEVSNAEDRDSGGLRIRRGYVRVLDAVAKDFAAGERLDTLDSRRDEESHLARREWRGNFNHGIQRILLQAVETDAALGYVFTFDDFVSVSWVADARVESDADAHVAPFVDGPPVCIQRASGNPLRSGPMRRVCRCCHFLRLACCEHKFRRRRRGC